jgi:hypothetical protein
MARQKMILESQREEMIANYRRGLIARDADSEHDPKPVLKIFNPCGAATWLLTEIDEDEPDRAFGLCDLGMGYPELGWVSFEEMASISLPFGMYLERDIHFNAKKPLSEYAAEARRLGRIEVC